MPLFLGKVWSWLKVAGTWLKGNFLLVLLLVGMIYAFIFAKNKSALYDQLLKDFQNQQAQNKKDLDALKKIQQDQIEKQQEIDRKYHEVVEKIEKDFQDQLKALDAAKQAEIKTIIEQNHDDPKAMAEELNKLLGIPLYQVQT